MKKWLIVPAMLLLLTASDCRSPQADRVQEKETEELAAEAHRQLGMPDIINFTERRFMKQILELRDRETTTHTYIIDYNGDLHYLCQSIGYGLPYSTQYTNPSRLERWGTSGGGAALPQPDPNGLFMPDGMAATWVLCLDESDGDIDPLYIEPEILVSPFRLLAAGGDYYSAELQAERETAGIQ
jgi:hypothetical protein